MYVDEINLKPVTRLFDMVVVTAADADGLYKAIKESIKEKLIPLTIVIGFSSDTCSVMFGRHHSVARLLKNELPYVVTIKCSCHMINLCASQACLKLSKSLEDLCRNIYAHFSRSILKRL